NVACVDVPVMTTHSHSECRSLRRPLRVVCGWLRAAFGWLLIAVYWLPIAFFFARSSLLPVWAASVRARHAPFPVALTLLIFAQSRLHAFQPRAALLHDDVRLPHVAVVVVRTGIP